MFKLIKAIMPRSDNFFDLFEAQAGKAQEAAQTLRRSWMAARTPPTNAPGCRRKRKRPTRSAMR
jgi:hypothetical protein